MARKHGTTGKPATAKLKLKRGGESANATDTRRKPRNRTLANTDLFMKKLSSLTLSILFLVSITAAAPVQVEVQKLFGATVSDQANVTVQSKSVQPTQRDAFSIFSTSDDEIIEPGDDLRGELELTIDCGSADICYADYWLEVDGQNHFAHGNTYYASDGETITVKVDFEAPDTTGVYLGYWHRGSEYSTEDGVQIDTDSFIVAEDSDGDGVADSEDECPNTEGSKLYDGCPPPDQDGDGVPDDEDECPSTGDQGFGLKDNGCPIQDSDGDGIPDPEDDCPDTTGTEATDGCPDSDGDGVRDSEDEFPNDPDCVEDSDGDGVCDSKDAFPNDPSVSEDSDGDGVGDANDEFPNDPDCVEDSDGDGVCDTEDEFPNDPSCIEDSDNDGVCDSEDEFPDNPNCVEDSDGDGVCDSEDAFPNDPSKTSDTDEDGVADSVDECPDQPGLKQFNGCPDSDGDGVPDDEDACPSTNSSEVDETGCPVPTDNETDDGTNDNEDTDGTDDDEDRELGNSFDQQVFQALENLYNSIRTVFS